MKGLITVTLSLSVLLIGATTAQAESDRPSSTETLGGDLMLAQSIEAESTDTGRGLFAVESVQIVQLEDSLVITSDELPTLFNLDTRPEASNHISIQF